MKKFSRFYLHNPLKRFDSDERIQGNPRKSNPSELRFSQRKGRPAKKIQTGRPGHCRERSQTDSIPMRSALAEDPSEIGLDRRKIRRRHSEAKVAVGRDDPKRRLAPAKPRMGCARRVD